MIANIHINHVIYRLKMLKSMMHTLISYNNKIIKNRNDKTTP